MDFVSTYSVNFIGANKVSIDFRTYTSDEYIQAAELLMFTSSAIRLLSILGNTHHGIVLRTFLSQEDFASGQQSYIEYQHRPQLVSVDGAEVKSRYVANGKLNDIAGYEFNLLPTGFGFTGRKAKQYGPDAVLMLMVYLRKKYTDDQNFAKLIQDIGDDCVHAASNMQLAGNQHLLSWSIIESRMDASLFGSDIKE